MSIAKLFGLIVVVLAAMSMVGSGSAYAEEIALCKVNETFCKAANVASEEFTATSEATLDFGEAGIVKCSSSLTESEISRISALSFSGCTEGCTVKANSLPYGDAYFELSEGSSKLLIYNAGNGEPKLAVKCGTAECVFSVSSIETEFKGGKAALIPMSEVLTEKEKSFFCPETVKWSATYLTSPSSLFVSYLAIEGPGFCEVNKELCPQESVITEAVSTLSSTGMTVGKLVAGGSITCTTGSFVIRREDWYDPESLWRYKPVEFNECTSATYTSCTVEYEGQPYGAEILPTVEGNGEIRVSEWPLSKNTPTLKISCTYMKTPFTCLYVTPEFSLEFLGGASATMFETASLNRLEGLAFFCPKVVSLSGEYETYFNWEEKAAPFYMTQS